MASIRVLDYNGDLDTLNEVFLIGPYEPDAAASETARLTAVAPFGGYSFEVTDLSSDTMADPASFAAAASADEFETAFYAAFYS